MLLEMEKLTIEEGKNLQAQMETINQTMREEAKSEHFLQWAWRPIIGLTFALVIINNYILVGYLSQYGVHSIDIPGEVWNAILVILGAASAFRGWSKVEKEKKAEQSAQKKSVKSKRTSVFSYGIVKEPHISEKATALSETNHYSFKVYSNANKIEIKKAVEGIYGVDVLSVNIIKIPKKKRRLGKVQGFKAGYTKAIVKIKEGQKIEIL